eukprot:TRINITY_DN3750_c0_g3_i1.p2 TRINITY_DN3750_c0_g3~~TRINITY_DN3750_c0_g3_i1.p2  ORF type:complete len:222 (-),score=57.19 TRINITY_DN3750_c0_g3_i1:99-743(-)
MEGRAAAAVEDCMQMFGTYFDFKQLARIHEKKMDNKPWMPKFLYDKKTCVFNRGVLVIDVPKWNKMNMTGTIEWWMFQFQRAENTLYKFGLSQPPFLLTLYRRYKKLDRCWNTRGLGRDRFGEKERDYFFRIGLGRPPKRPFLSPWADEAKILHFNGKFKPWRGPRVRPPGHDIISLCGKERIECSTLWWKFLSPQADYKLQPDGQRTTKEEYD